MSVQKLLFAVAAAISMSGCSKAPSDNDAKQVVLQLLGDCKYLSLDSFEKTNGMPVGEDAYGVSIKYSVKVTPPPESKTIVSSVSQQISDLDALIESATKERDQKAMERASIEAQNDPAALSSFIHEQYNPSINKVNALEEEKRKLLLSAYEPIKAKFAEACPALSATFYAELYNGLSVTQYADSFTKEFTGNIQLVKTEKGWVAGM